MHGNMSVKFTNTNIFPLPHAVQDAWGYLK